MQRYDALLPAHRRARGALRACLEGVKTRSTSSLGRCVFWKNTNRKPTRLKGLRTVKDSTPCRFPEESPGTLFPDAAALHINYRFAPNKTLDEAKHTSLSFSTAMNLTS